MIAEIILIIVFLFFFILGYYIIYRQVILVKKGIFSLKDGLLCGFYGFIFSMAIMIVMSMAFIFAIKTPELWEFIQPQENIHPIMLILPIAICLGYITIYPLIDFLYIAMNSESQEGLTIFHKVISKNFINRANSKIFSLFMALFLYFLLFLLPPILLTLTDLPFIFIWITWFLVYPLMILAHYGSKGYIAGISNNFYHIPDLKRSIFLGFEDSKRSFKEFSKSPLPRILIGLMIFVFFWQWISLIQTLNFLFTGSLTISTYSYSGMVFVTLLFGIIGYFTRFWGRKIKYRGIDLFFSAYLMAAVGINILVNFLIVNIDKIENTLNAWGLTSQITSNPLLFAIPAIIEEVFVILFILYYFLHKKNSFIANFINSKITVCGQTFDPIPLFNFIKSKNSNIRNHAKKTLINMYERIPLKIEIDLNKEKYKHSLLDGLCDPDPLTRRISYNILIQLEQDAPDVILPWIIENLHSPNYDKIIPITRSLLEIDINFLKRIPKQLLYGLLNDTEWRVKKTSLKLILRLLDNDKNMIGELDIHELLNNPNNDIQIEFMKTLFSLSIPIPEQILINKIDHKNKAIKAIAIKNLKNLTEGKLKPKIVSKLIPLMTDPSSSVRASIFELFAEIGQFNKYSISISPFLAGLIDPDGVLRNASILGLIKYAKEKPKSIDIDKISERINKKDANSLISILTLFGMLWDKDPEKILKILLDFIIFDDKHVKDKVSDILVEKYETKPELIFNNLIQIPEISKFITKGIVSKTLIRIAKKDPKKIIPMLNKIISEMEKEDICFNAVSTLEGITNEYYELIDIRSLVSILKRPKNPKLKKEIINILMNIGKIDSKHIKSIIPDLLDIFYEQEISFKITFVKSLIEIAEKTPDIINTETIIKILDDKDSFIRESITKILGKIGNNIDEYKKSIEIILNKALIDEDWIVREAAVSSLGEIINKLEEKGFIIKKLIPFLDDNESWVRRSVLLILSDIKNIPSSEIPFQKILQNINHEDENVRQAAAGLLNIFDYNYLEEIFDKVLSLLEDPSEDVRNQIINVMIGVIKKEGIQKILPNLLKHLSDEFSIILQRSIALILGRTVIFYDEKIKKRVVSLLKIRCEMSQDETICKIYHQLKED
ncbi:MAG: HEAT repeat domain-containing protein [Candidatus Lokiarchaeota archaeon]|nr:HEAT repeat domain-containing protein [Candidatus Lokiarchaeota archaeon]